MMKKLFILFLLLPLFSSAQKFEKKIFKPGNTIVTSFSFRLALRGDTLLVYPGDDIKFIKLGNRIYKITEPLLEEVIADSAILWFDTPIRPIHQSFKF